MALTELTLPALLSRTRDVVAEVRADAFRLLGERVGVNALRIGQRVSLLHGLLDPDQNVVQRTVELVQRWLATAGGPVDLMIRLDVESFSDELEPILNKFLDTRYDRSNSSSLTYVPAWEPATLETVFFNRLYVSMLKRSGSAVFEDFLPELTTICKMLIESTDDYVTVELLKLAQLHDFKDEAGKVLATYD